MKTLFIILFAATALVSCHDFIEKDITSESVEILAPATNSVFPEGEVRFSWELLEGADSYRLIIASPSLAQARRIISDTLIVPDSAAHSASHTEFLEAGKYQWSLQGRNPAGQSLRRVYCITIEEPEETSDKQE